MKGSSILSDECQVLKICPLKPKKPDDMQHIWYVYFYVE